MNPNDQISLLLDDALHCHPLCGDNALAEVLQWKPESSDTIRHPASEFRGGDFRIT